MKFDPLPQGKGRITGVFQQKFLGFIRDDTTHRELIFMCRDVVPAEAWGGLKVGDRVRYFVEADFVHPGRFKAVDVSRDEAMTGGPPWSTAIPGAVEFRVEAAENPTEAKPGDAHREEDSPRAPAVA